MTVIKVGTRQSKLAMTQSRQVISRLRELNPDVIFELVTYKTTGDHLVNVSLDKIGGKGVFVKDIERALLSEEIDMAVHSLKDVPAILAEGCTIGAIPKRQDVRDCLILRESGFSFETLKPGSVIGTSSQRRKAQLQEKRPDLIFKPIRGNIDTRIGKLEKGEFDAIVLAMAGLNRMGWTNRDDLNLEVLSLETCLPAISQGALCLECRKDDREVLERISKINDVETSLAVAVERKVLSLMNADCTFPIAALAQLSPEGYQLEVMLADSYNKCHRVSSSGSDGALLAQETVSKLMAEGVVGIR